MKSRELICIAILSGCGGGGGGALTCELLADPGNCWAEAAIAFAACIPARATPGMLAADRASCTFSDGVRVVFDAPLPMSGLDLDRLGLSVLATSGTECGRFVDTAMNRQELTAGGETVVGALDGNGFHLRCDGDEYTTSFDDVIACGPPAVLPSGGVRIEATSVTFTIASVATPGQLFRCD